MNGPWRIRLLGELRVQRGDKNITRFNSQKTAGLLAYLAYYLQRVHARELLVDQFWRDSAPEAGRNSLSVALSTLRSQLEPPGVPSGAVILADRWSVGLNPQSVTTDTAEFEAALQTAAASGATDRISFLSQALDLYSGRLLPGYYEDWIAVEEERLSGRFFDAVSQLLTDLEARGDLAAALPYARKAVSMDPLREGPYQSLMRLLAAAGQPGAALQAYRELERRLEEEVGEEPTAVLRSLARQIERQSGLSVPALPFDSLRISRPAPGALQRESVSNTPITLTFLKADWDAHPSDKASGEDRQVLSSSQEILPTECARHGGQEIQASENAFLVAFASAGNALACALSVQQTLAETQSQGTTYVPLPRIALHTGDVVFQEGIYQGPALQQIHWMLTPAHEAQILVSETTAALIQTMQDADVRLADLGMYRLKGLSKPVRLFQAEYAAMPERGFGPLSAEAGYASHLPLRFTRFFGRQKELAQLREILLSGDRRLVSVVGVGGTGKTRLALEAAEHLESDYAGAVWFVPLADVGDPGLIISAILDSLGAPRSSHREPLEQAVEILARQPSLVVLDNMEQLVEGGAKIVQSLLERIPDLTLLITSRQSLGLAAEHVFPLSPLPTPNGEQALERLRLLESVELFIDRAQKVKPDFQVTNSNAAAVAALVEGLEGIPLAIELAAARAQVFTPAQMLSHLSQRFGFLVSRRRDVSDRHRTLKAAIEWSYRLLPPEAQRFFCRLSVFRGGWTVAAAEEVCEEPLALDLLALLRDCSLIEVGETERGMRFRVLETLREFGWEQLSVEQRTERRRRHVQYLLALTDTSGAPQDDAMEIGWIRQWEEELANVVAALDWSASDIQSVEPGLRLAMALRGFWWARDQMTTGFNYLATLLDSGGESLSLELRAAGLQAAGGFVWEDWTLARTLLEQSLTLSRQCEDPELIEAALLSLGGVCVHLGEKDLAQAYLEEGLQLSKQLGRMEQVAGAYLNLSQLARRRGDREESYALASQAVALWRVHGKTTVLPSYLIHLAHVAPDVAAAGKHLEETLEHSRASGWKHGIACAFDGLGWIAYREGDFKTAVSCFQECLTIWSGAYEGSVILRASNLLSLALLGSGELEAAEALMIRNLKEGREAGDRYWTAISVEGMANLALTKQQWERAARLFGAAPPQPNWFGSLCPPHSPLDREAPFAALKRALGEEAFAAAHEAGRAMTWEQAIAYALE